MTNLGFGLDPRRACEGKRKYLTKWGAKRAAKQTQTHAGGGRIRVYRCVHCGALHVGHAGGKRQVA